MRRTLMLLLPLLVLSTGTACGRPIEGESSGGVTKPLPTNITGGPGSSFVSAARAGANEISAGKQHNAVMSSPRKSDRTFMETLRAHKN